MPSITPAIHDAMRAEDPFAGLLKLMEAAISLGAREHNILAAARRAGSLTPDISISLYEAMGELADRAQRAGLVRADLVADDLPRLVAMLHSVLWTMDSTGDGWRRYVALILGTRYRSTEASRCRPRLLFGMHHNPAAGRCDRPSKLR